MKPNSPDDLKAWLTSFDDLSLASVAQALQFIDARPDSIAAMVRAERIDHTSPRVFAPTFRFRWRRHSIRFERAPIHAIGAGFSRDEVGIWSHCDDSDDGEGYHWKEIDADFLEYFDELSDRESYVD